MPLNPRLDRLLIDKLRKLRYSPTVAGAKNEFWSEEELQEAVKRLIRGTEMKGLDGNLLRRDARKLVGVKGKNCMFYKLMNWKDI